MFTWFYRILTPDSSSVFGLKRVSFSRSAGVVSGAALFANGNSTWTQSGGGVGVVGGSVGVGLGGVGSGNWIDGTPGVSLNRAVPKLPATNESLATTSRAPSFVNLDPQTHPLTQPPSF